MLLAAIIMGNGAQGWRGQVVAWAWVAIAVWIVMDMALVVKYGWRWLMLWLRRPPEDEFYGTYGTHYVVKQHKERQ